MLLNRGCSQLACVLRRVAHGTGTKSAIKESPRDARNQNEGLRYSVKFYAPEELKILGGMRQVLARAPNDLVRRGFESMLFNLHQRGL